MAAYSKPIRLSPWTRYLRSLETNPVFTKACTSGFLNLLQELVASKLSGYVVINELISRMVKMGGYGFLISGPLGHYLFAALARAFEGTTGIWSILGQMVGANFVIAPIQNLVYLTAMAVIGGQPLSVIPKQFLPLMKITVQVFPLVQLFASKFLPPHLWLPFFNLVGFVFGVYINYTVRKNQKKGLKGKGKEKNL
ncbi:hypothetical protein BKA69DRAFT_798710 [Paraphysoderma sedebokerense]|nr:hypothetical protein BKA69DRAFT_798710 [Paraphysoderma sedebokerense]